MEFSNAMLQHVDSTVWKIVLESLEMVIKLEAMEMWCHRRILKMSWTKKVTNEENGEETP